MYKILRKNIILVIFGIGLFLYTWLVFPKASYMKDVNLAAHLLIIAFLSILSIWLILYGLFYIGLYYRKKIKDK